MPVEKRLDDLALGLTVRERVALAIRPWMAGEVFTHDLARNCPEADRQEMEGLFHAIEHGNQLLGDSIAFSLEWLNAEEITFAWLECLAAFVTRERTRSLPKRALPNLPPPGRGFVRDLPMAHGQRVGEDDPVPATWEEAVKTLTCQMCRAVDLRWRGAVMFEEACALGCDAFGHDIVHVRLRNPVVVLRAKVLDLHQAMQPFEAFALPELSAEDHEQALEYFDLSALRGATSNKGPREQMWPSKLAEVETEEARLAAELRTEHDAS